MDHNNKHASGLHKDEYYGPLLFSYIDTILRSGEILEDDFQAVFSVFRIEMFETDKKTSLPYGLIASAFTVLSSMIAAKKLGSLFYVAPSAVFTTSCACYYLFKRRRKIKHETLIEDLVRALKNIQLLNKRINKYLAGRKKLINECSRYYFKPLSNTVNTFVKKLLAQQSYLHKLLINGICNFSQYCDPLREDCMLLKDFESSSLIDLKKNELDDSIKYTNDVIDLQQLLSSKLLSYFAIICCWEETPLNKEIFESLISDKLPCMVESLLKYYKKISELFHSFRSTFIKFSERELDKKTITKSQLPGKLRHDIDTSINNLSFVLEILQNIADNIEKSDGVIDRTKIDQALTDARKHIGDTYDAIDILCKIYGKLSKNKQNHELSLTVPTEKSETNEVLTNSDFQSNSHIDPIDLIEDKEKYKLYVKASESVDESQPIYEEESDTYLRLVIKELQQNLNHHAFYASAKKRWRDESDEEESDEDANSSYDDEITVTENPSFSSEKTDSLVNSSLNETLHSKRSDIPKDQVSSTVEVQERNGDLLRTENVDKIDTLTRAMEIEEQTKWNPILQGIKALSQNIQMQEETFGEDDDSD